MVGLSPSGSLGQAHRLASPWASCPQRLASTTTTPILPSQAALRRIGRLLPGKEQCTDGDAATDSVALPQSCACRGNSVCGGEHQATRPRAWRGCHLPGFVRTMAGGADRPHKIGAPTRRGVRTPFVIVLLLTPFKLYFIHWRRLVRRTRSVIASVALIDHGQRRIPCLLTWEKGFRFVRWGLRLCWLLIVRRVGHR